jgi:hypothetical protein
MLRTVILLFAAATAVLAQKTAFDRLKREAASLKAVPEEKITDDHVAMAAPLHLALRDWIESRLPEDKGLLSVTFGNLESSMQDELKAGLTSPGASPAATDNAYPDGFGAVDVKLTRFPEMPDSLFVTAGVGVPCGEDEAVYKYDFDADSRKRVLEDHPKSEWGYAGAALQLSDPDPQGNRLLLVHRISTQCASLWMGVAYSVYRLGYLPGTPEPLLSGEHDFYLTDDGPGFVLKPNELIMEFLGSSVDVDILIRTQIHRYKFAIGSQRLDPVAFQPQDFVEEWLTRPWSEMQSRSEPETKDWHTKIHADFVLADYSNVVPCLYRPGRWLISLDITNIGEKKLDEPLQAHFLVRELGDYHYRMEAVSESELPGCPGEGSASEKHPWLSASDLKALR